MAGYDSLYFGKVIRDSDIINKSDTRPYNRVKVLIVGHTSAENEFFITLIDYIAITREEQSFNII